MLILTDIQKQNILKYVDDKTYTQRWGFIIGVLSAIAGVGSMLTVSDIEVKANAVYLAVIGVAIAVGTFRNVMRFRHVREYIHSGGFIASKKQVSANCIDETTTTANYSNSLKDSYLYSNNDPPRNSTVAIKKYYIFDKYNVKYECIKYLDYKKSIEQGEFIAVDFPTGEKFAFYE